MTPAPATSIPTPSAARRDPRDRRLAPRAFPDGGVRREAPAEWRGLATWLRPMSASAVALGEGVPGGPWREMAVQPAPSPHDGRRDEWYSSRGPLAWTISILHLALRWGRYARTLTGVLWARDAAPGAMKLCMSRTAAI